MTAVPAHADHVDATGLEETLDPETWDELRSLGHRMIDDMFEHYGSLREQPAWRPMPEAVRRQFRQALPREGQGAVGVYEDFGDYVLPYVTGNVHPRFWGWVCGTGTGLSMLAELLAGAVNSSVDGFDDAGTHVEAQVMDWCKQMLGWRPAASGLLVSGCSMANFVGLTVARNTWSGGDVKRNGLADAGRLVVYASTEAHSSIQRAVQMLGLGVSGLHRVPVDIDFRMNLDELERAIAQDRAQGRTPLAIVGTAGTVNTGAIDDLSGLADIAAHHGLWFHLDGAFGICTALSPRHRPALTGYERADSLAFDLHKWMYFPYEAGCVLVRSDAEHRAAFKYDAAYMTPSTRGLSAERSQQFTEYRPQLSRSFRALKIWMGMKEHGIDKFRRLIEQNISQADYLARLIDAAPDLELLAPVTMNVACFRYVAPLLSDAELDTLNEELLNRLQESGIAVPSHTVINGHYALRVANTNHRTRASDFDILVRALRSLGADLADDQSRR